MKLKMIGLGGLLLLMGCRAPVDGKNFYLSSSEKASVLERCRSLNAIGNLAQTRGSISKGMRKIKEILGQEDVIDHKDELIALSEKIKASSDRLLLLATPENVDPAWPQRLVWRLTWTDLGLSPKPGRGLWHLRSAHLSHAYNWEGENENLLDRTSIQQTSEGLLIQFARTTSLIEICQLQETIVFALEAEFEGPLQKRTVTYRLLAKNSGEP